MNIQHHPELVERLAAAYALGTLRAGARRRFEQLARRHPELRLAAIGWQSRLGGIAELQPPVAPDPALWRRIDNLVRAEREQQRLAARRQAPAATLPARWFERLAFWRTAAASVALASALGGWVAVGLHREQAQALSGLQAQLQSQSRIEYVAVMSDARGRSSGPQILVTFDANRQRLTLQRVGGYQEASDKSLQLWALPAHGRPRSLGVLGGEKLTRLTAAADEVGAAPALAISLEPRGGVPGERGPTGPVLFSGPLIHSASL